MLLRLHLFTLVSKKTSYMVIIERIQIVLVTAW
jgi:hypothetical protein